MSAVLVLLPDGSIRLFPVESHDDSDSVKEKPNPVTAANVLRDFPGHCLFRSLPEALQEVAARKQGCAPLRLPLHPATVLSTSRSYTLQTLSWGLSGSPSNGGANRPVRAASVPLPVQSHRSLPMGQDGPKTANQAAHTRSLSAIVCDHHHHDDGSESLLARRNSDPSRNRGSLRARPLSPLLLPPRTATQLDPASFYYRHYCTHSRNLNGGRAAAVAAAAEAAAGAAAEAAAAAAAAGSTRAAAGGDKAAAEATGAAAEAAATIRRTAASPSRAAVSPNLPAAVRIRDSLSPFSHVSATVGPTSGASLAPMSPISVACPPSPSSFSHSPSTSIPFPRSSSAATSSPGSGSALGSWMGSSSSSPSGGSYSSECQSSTVTSLSASSLSGRDGKGVRASRGSTARPPLPQSKSLPAADDQ